MALSSESPEACLQGGLGFLATSPHAGLRGSLSAAERLRRAPQRALSVLAAGSALAAGLYSPQVCANRPSLSHALLPFSHLFLSFVFVWLVVWVGVSFVPLGVALSGSSTVDAFVSFVFMLAWLLLCALASLA